MTTYNNYANMLNSYGFNDKDSFETYPEERRNWRKTIKLHVDEAMGIDDEQIKNGDNMTKRLEEVHEDINNNVDTKTEEIKANAEEKSIEIKAHVTSEINDVQTVIDDIQDTVNEINTHLGFSTNDNSTVKSRLVSIEEDTNALLRKLPDSVYHNYL